MRGISFDGSAVRDARLASGWTQESLADAARCDAKTVRNAEKGSRLDAATAKRIADALGQTLASLAASDAGHPVHVAASVDLYHRWQVAHNDRDVEALVGFYHPQAALVIHGAEDLPGGGQFEGLAGIRRHFCAAFAAFQTERITPDRCKVDAVGPYIFCRVVSTAIVRATGQSFTAMVIHELQLEDQKILLHTVVTDTACIRGAINAPTAEKPASRGRNPGSSR